MDFQTVISYWQRLKENPKRLLRLLFSPCARGMFLHALTEEDAYKFVNHLTAIKESVFRRLLSEIRSDQPFFDHLKKKYLQVRKVALPQPQGWTELVYIIIRSLKPKAIVETGVFDGISSAFILNALSKNHSGSLFSVDKPARQVILKSTDLMPFETLPPKKRPGWLVPPYLRSRWKLLITEEKNGLVDLLTKVRTVDIFLHDSLHTEEHMFWEMKTVYPYIPKNGLLLIDDCFCNHAFKKFCQEAGKQPVFKFGLGAIRK